MQRKWQGWFAATVSPLLSYSRGAPLSPELKALCERDPAEIDLALLAADTDRTQAYVFESAKLPEVRGGSELLRQLNEEALPEVFETVGLPKNFIDDKPEPGCVIYAGGGGLLAFVPASIAADLAEQIEALYPTVTGKATISCVYRPVTPGEIMHGWGGRALSCAAVNAKRGTLNSEDWRRIAQAYGIRDGGVISEAAFGQQRGFGQIVQVMGTLLRQKKDCPAVLPVIETLPFASRCKVCQVRPAQAVYKYFGESWPLCDVCRRKVLAQMGGAREGRKQQIDRFLDWLDTAEGYKTRYFAEVAEDLPDLPQDMGELGAASKTRPYIGFVYADGNHMGQVLEHLTTPKAYREFSKALQESLKTSLYQALAEHLNPTLIDRVSPTGQPLGKGYIHPMEPLVIGGDDVMVALPGDAAFPVGVRLCQLFEREMACRISEELRNGLPEELRCPTLSVGVVIADSHNPVSVLQRVAKELCKSAKRRAHDESERQSPLYTSALDFLLIKSQSMLRRDVNQLRRVRPYYYPEGSARVKAGRLLTGAPYTLQEGERLLKILKLMREVDFPASQLQGLVAALHRGRQYGSITYLYQEVRLRSRYQDVLGQIQKIWQYDDKRDPVPWHRLDPTAGLFASIVPDLLELYPLVPKQGETLWQDTLKEAGDDQS